MRRTKAQAEITRQHILDTALQLFDEQGYAQTSLSMIARTAGVTRGAIYWHFQNKEEIFHALADAQFAEILAENAAAIAAPNTWSRLIDNFSRFYRELSHQPAQLRFFRIIHQQKRHDSVLAELRDRYHERWQQQCRDAVERGKANGELPADADADYLFFHLNVIFRGLAEVYLDEPHNPDHPAYGERLIRSMVASLQKPRGKA
ncbi:MAG: TetR family transcriptional regulator [Cardiobacteriaceae bacterium]|nr:TetR family transcriptional regulator [Cardiobacteriaceae bacterium]